MLPLKPPPWFLWELGGPAFRFFRAIGAARRQGDFVAQSFGTAKLPR